MAGFLDDWRKPSRLLQDVKTKSIERLLLPLIKQVRNFSSPSRTLPKSENGNRFFLNENHIFSFMSARWKFDGKWKLKFFCEWDDDDDERGSFSCLLDAILRCYPFFLFFRVNYISALNMNWKGLPRAPLCVNPIHHIVIIYFLPQKKTLWKSV